MNVRLSMYIAIYPKGLCRFEKRFIYFEGYKIQNSSLET